MHLRVKHKSGLQSAIDRVADRASDVAQTVAEEGRTVMEQRAESKAQAKESAMKAKGKKQRKHRLRRAVALTGIGAVAAYFLDPDNGSQRRETARRRTSTSSRVVGNGLDRAAQVAHHTAEATAVAPDPVGDPLLAEDMHLS